MITPDQTYCHVNGFVKNIKETAMLIALRVVVTVTAVVAPVVRTRVKTTCIPKYPVILSKKLYP